MSSGRRQGGSKKSEDREEAPLGGAYYGAAREAIRYAVGSALRLEGSSGGLVEALKSGLREGVKRYLLSRVRDENADKKNKINGNKENVNEKSVCWRCGLRGALAFADRLLEEVSRGLDEHYGLVVDLRFRLAEKGLSGSSSGFMATLLEVGLAFDQLLGLPYYPGSTLKGAVRSAAESLLGEEPAALLFGDRGRAGAVVFADSYPVGCWRKRPCLVVTGDVVTPHYFVPNKGIVGAEYEAKPTPIFHLAVAPGTVFRVVAGVDLARLGEEGARSVIRAAREKGLLSDGEAGLPQREVALGLVVARLVASALAGGIAARSGKGYNILLPVDPGEVSRDVIVGFRFRVKGEGGGRGGKQAR